MTPMPGFPIGRLPHATTLGIKVVFGLAAGLLVGGVFTLFLASTPGMPLAGRILLGALGVLELLLPGRIAFISIQRYRREGRWTTSDEERLATRMQVRRSTVATRIVESAYFDLFLASVPAACLAIQFRPGHKPLDHLDLGLVLLYVFLLAQGVSGYVRKIRGPRTA